MIFEFKTAPSLEASQDVFRIYSFLHSMLQDAPSGTPCYRTRMLHEDTISHLRTLLIEGQIAPGSRIQEQVLCAELGISRTPLREALKVLAAEGHVVLLPHR